MKLVFVLVSTVALATACASGPEQANEASGRNQRDIDKMMSAPCCTAHDLVPYLPIAKGKNPPIEINEKSPLIEVGNSRSFAGGILVPPQTVPTHLTIRSVGIGIWAPSALNFFPSFIFFEQDGTPLVKEIKWNIRPVRADWSDRPSLEALIELPPSTTATRVLVYAQSEALNKRSPLIVDAGVFMVPNGIYGSFRAYLQ